MAKVVSAKDESKRLFQSDFLEFFTKVHWSVPLILYVPLVGYCLFRSIQDPGASWQFIVGGVLFGLLFWSLLEYVLHRFVFHFRAKSKFGKRIFYLIHEIHHEYPQDSLRLVMPPVESIPLAFAFYFGLQTFMPSYFFYPFFVGLVSGYLSYDMIHFSSHHLAMRGRLGSFIKQWHLHHHFKQDNKGYGVSSPLWDWVFRSGF